MARTITMTEVKNMGVDTFSKKDNSPRGVKTVYVSELKIGDKIVLDDYFTEIVDEPITDTETVDETVTESDYQTYNRIKMDFFRNRSDIEWTIHTSSMDQYGTYYKDYSFSNGDTWYERMSLEQIPTETTVKGCQVEFIARLQKIEYWSTEDAHSRYYYESYR